MTRARNITRTGCTGNCGQGWLPCTCAARVVGGSETVRSHPRTMGDAFRDAEYASAISGPTPPTWRTRLGDLVACTAVFGLACAAIVAVVQAIARWSA